MYAHQVITDLEKTLKTRTLPDFRYREGIKILIKSIKESQHFFLGEFQDLKKPLATTLTDDVPLFLNESSQFARLPYKQCWFEFDNKLVDVPAEEDIPKRGMFVMELGNDLIWVWIVNYMKAMDLWLLSPQQYYISIGKTLSENEFFLGMFSAFNNEFSSSEIARNNMLNSNVFPMPLSDALDPHKSQEMAKDDTRDLYVLNSALLLLNCKNICTEEVQPPPKLNKKRKKRGKQELFTYKTLHLELPTTHKTDSGTSIEESKDLKRIHLCRGHFKIYTESNRLFGKYTGVYWWQPHLRGEKKEGMVNKEYSVKTTNKKLTNKVRLCEERTTI